MKTYLIISILLVAGMAQAGILEELQGLECLPYAERSATVVELLSRYPINPIVMENDSTVLLYHGGGRILQLAGDRTAWEPLDVWRHLRGTNLWYTTQHTPPNARLDYKIVRDGDWMLDPRNLRTIMSGFGPNSELPGRQYREPTWMSEQITVNCRLDTLTVDSPELGNSRTIVVVIPPNTNHTPRTFLMVHDGLEYLSLAGLSRYLATADVRDDLTLPICVCVPPVNRTEEYAGSHQEAFGRFVMDTLIPLIEERYATEGIVGRPWGSLGASYGGRISLDLARRYPGHFDRLAPMSPSVGPAQQEGVATLDPAGMRLYLNWGTYDLPILIPKCEAFAAMLEERGFDHLIEVLPQGHSWGLWRDTLEAAFTFLYSDRP